LPGAARDGRHEQPFFSDQVVSRVEAIEENGLWQAEILIKKYFRLSDGELGNLTDDEFFDLAAGAYYLRKQEAEAVREGICLALGEK
jgi:hypothetical protein